MRAAIYCRISEDRDGEGLGVARQERACRKLIDDRGWTLTDLHIDNDTSAYTGKARPHYARLLEAIEAGTVDVVVAWASDRLTRHPKELEHLIDVLEASQVGVTTVTSGTYDLSSPEGRASARIFGAMARQESERKSVRQRAKHQELAQAGLPAGGGTRPFGFEDDHVTIREDEAKLIRDAAERVASGEPMRAVLRDWQDQGVETVKGGRWSTSSFRRMLTSGRVAGIRYHKGERVGPAVWDGIITPAQHERLLAVLTDPKRRTTPVLVRRYLLTGGMLVCGREDCGAPMVARPTEDGRRKYVCASGLTGDFRGCGRLASLAEPLETEVRDQLLAALDGPGLADALDAALAGSEDADVAGELIETRDRRDDLAGAYAAGDLSRSEWEAARKVLTGTIDRLEARAARVDRSGMLATVAASTEGLADLWEGADVTWRRGLLETVVESVVLHPAVRGRNVFDPDRVEIVWRY